MTPHSVIKKIRSMPPPEFPVPIKELRIFPMRGIVIQVTATVRAGKGGTLFLLGTDGRVYHANSGSYMKAGFNCSPTELDALAKLKVVSRKEINETRQQVRLANAKRLLRNYWSEAVDGLNRLGMKTTKAQEAGYKRALKAVK